MYSLIPNRDRSRTFNELGTFGGLMRLLDDMTPTWSGNLFRTDILDRGDHFSLQAELPGFRKEDIQLDVKEGTLTITASHDENNERKDERYLCRERRTGSMTRSFNLDGINEEAITATFENGVLELTLPKIVPPQPETRRIAIQ